MPRKTKIGFKQSLSLFILSFFLFQIIFPFAYSLSSYGFNGKTFSVSSPIPLPRAIGASLHFQGELENDFEPESTGFGKGNFGWTRTCNFIWIFMEPEQGNFSVIDDPNAYPNVFIQNMKKIDTKILALLDTVPYWLNESTTWYVAPENRNLFFNYVNQTVSNYQNDVAIWEIINEPNNVWGKFKGTWDEYLAVLIGSAETIKRINASIDILVGGLGGTRELEFLDYIMKNLTSTPSNVPGFATAKDLFIGIAFHPYLEPAENLVVKLKEYDEVLKKYNWTTRDGARHWITEIGGSTESEKEQLNPLIVDYQREFASLVMKQVAIALSWRVEGFNIWTYRDFEDPGKYNQIYAHCGVVFANGSWKPVMHGLNWSNRYLANGFTELVPFEATHPITGIAVKDTRIINGTQRWAFVLWNSQSKMPVQVRLSFTKSVSFAQRSDFQSANTWNLDRYAGNRSLKLSIDYEPILIVVDTAIGAIPQLEIVSDGFHVFLLISLSSGISLGIIIALKQKSINIKDAKGANDKKDAKGAKGAKDTKDAKDAKDANDIKEAEKNE